jgi:hypothetical protein
VYVQKKKKGHGELIAAARNRSYLRIFGLSFSGKYLSQNGQ